MSNQLTDAEIAALMPSELCRYQTPNPTQIVASDEFYPDRRTSGNAKSSPGCSQIGDDLGSKQGLTAAGFSRPPPAWPHPLWR